MVRADSGLTETSPSRTLVHQTPYQRPTETPGVKEEHEQPQIGDSEHNMKFPATMHQRHKQEKQTT